MLCEDTQDEGEELLSVVESVALPVEHEEAAAEELVRLFPGEHPVVPFCFLHEYTCGYRPNEEGLLCCAKFSWAFPDPAALDWQDGQCL